jgi:tetratricopeptide (TPR) repeat protein
MATCPNQQFRDDKRAVEAAQKAIELDGNDDYRYVETLAAALAAASDFEAAIEAQEKVVQMVPDNLRSRAEGRLELYRRETPYRELPREPVNTSARRQARRAPPEEQE